MQMATSIVVLCPGLWW